jgi:predicted helicase
MRKAKIYYYKIDDSLTKQQKLDFLKAKQDATNIEWREITPDKNYNWLTDDLQSDFESFIPLGSKEAKLSKTSDIQTIFKLYSNGISTNRDAWAYNFNRDELINNIKRMISAYNQEVIRWNQQNNQNIKLDHFVINDDSKIKWSSRLKECLLANKLAEFKLDNIRVSLYRAFSQQFLYFDNILTHRQGLFPQIFSNFESEKENIIISLAGLGDRKGFGCLVSNCIIALDFAYEKAQCFPFYTYNEDGSNRQENITDWALKAYQNHYQNNNITKWDIFYYIYAILHHPLYRNRYQANLKKELPRIPFAPEFDPFAIAGKQLADLHLNYENQEEYPLKFIENNEITLNWRVQKMRLSKDKTSIIYNEFLTLTGIPQEVFEYKLGNKSALDWIIDQYQIKTDKRSGIVNDPNRLDDEQYIVKLIGKIITVSLETVKIVNSLPDLGLS